MLMESFQEVVDGEGNLNLVLRSLIALHLVLENFQCSTQNNLCFLQMAVFGYNLKFPQFCRLSKALFTNVLEFGGKLISYSYSSPF